LNFLLALRQQRKQMMPNHQSEFPTHRYIIFFAVLVAFCLSSSAGFSDQTGISVIQNLLRNRIEAGGVPINIFVGEEPIYTSVALPLFYGRRIYKPAWVSDQGPLDTAAQQVKMIREVDREGLRPEDYHLIKLETILSQIRDEQEKQIPLNPQRLVDLDLLLTDSFLILGSHLLCGRIDPQTVEPQWHVNQRAGDLGLILDQALASGQIEAALRNLIPNHAGYRRLRRELARYREIAALGGWLRVLEGPKLQKGDSSASVSILKRRLAAEGYLENYTPENELYFDERLDRALRKFQLQNGLEVDGILGAHTRKALNMTVDDRIGQITANMERWRWLTHDLGSRYILVNIAGFYLEVIDIGRLQMTMKVVVGKPYRRTPVFTSTMTYLVFHPFWHVPARIAREDLLPKIKRDAAFLNKEKIRVFEGWGAEARKIDPAEIDWQKITAAGLKFRFRQDPGPQNALGRVKFMLPNPYDVYLHDTPARELFDKTRRDFSHGCIRIEKPLELAEYLLKNHPDWPPEKIRSTLAGSVTTEKTVKLPEPINVHVLYWTAWLGADNQIYFSADIYDRDNVLEAALNAPSPGH
jgi:murein L,D-transpeptidase YcbB/YkuD